MSMVKPTSLAEHSKPTSRIRLSDWHLRGKGGDSRRLSQQPQHITLSHYCCPITSEGHSWSPGQLRSLSASSSFTTAKLVIVAVSSKKARSGDSSQQSDHRIIPETAARLMIRS